MKISYNIAQQELKEELRLGLKLMDYISTGGVPPELVNFCDFNNFIRETTNLMKAIKILNHFTVI